MKKTKIYNGKAAGKFAPMHLKLMTTPAWRALSTVAQALYPWLILEWKGPKFNNNGKISFSVRQAAEAIGVSRNTAAKGFRELQAKGFIKVKRGASLGVSGHGKCPEYEVTDVPLLENGRVANQNYLNWVEGKDFEVFKHNTPCRPGKFRNLS